MGGPVRPGRLEREGERIDVHHLEPACGQRGTQHVSAQPFERLARAGFDARGRVQRESARGKAQRPALNAFLRIDEPPTNAFPRPLTGGHGAPDRSGGQGGQERLLLHEHVRRRVRLEKAAALEEVHDPVGRRLGDAPNVVVGESRRRHEDGRAARSLSDLASGD